MAQITLRVPDDLLERMDGATDPETSRSEWLRKAARRRLEEEQDVDGRLEEIEERLVHLEEEQDVGDRLEEIEESLARLEEEQQRPLYRRLFGD